VSVFETKFGSVLGIPEQFNENKLKVSKGKINKRFMVDYFGFRENVRIILIV
jgi:hypothetical protein